MDKTAVDVDDDCGVDLDGAESDIETINNVQVPIIRINLTDEQNSYLNTHFDPFQRCEDHCRSMLVYIINYLESLH